MIKIKYGETETTMKRVASQASGHTFYDKYQIENGPSFGMYRDHFDARRNIGKPVQTVEGLEIFVMAAPEMNAYESFGCRKDALRSR